MPARISVVHQRQTQAGEAAAGQVAGSEPRQAALRGAGCLGPHRGHDGSLLWRDFTEAASSVGWHTHCWHCEQITLRENPEAFFSLLFSLQLLPTSPGYAAAVRAAPRLPPPARPTPGAAASSPFRFAPSWLLLGPPSH